MPMQQSTSQQFTMQQNITTWINAHKSDYIDPLTGEYNLTALAESAAAEFDYYDPYYNIPDWIFELAFELTDSDNASQ